MIATSAGSQAERTDLSQRNTSHICIHRRRELGFPRRPHDSLPRCDLLEVTPYLAERLAQGAGGGDRVNGDDGMWLRAAESCRPGRVSIEETGEGPGRVARTLADETREVGLDGADANLRRVPSDASVLTTLNVDR
jgi:hypothetical protein